MTAARTRCDGGGDGVPARGPRVPGWGRVPRAEARRGVGAGRRRLRGGKARHPGFHSRVRRDSSNRRRRARGRGSECHGRRAVLHVLFDDHLALHVVTADHLLILSRVSHDRAGEGPIVPVKTSSSRRFVSSWTSLSPPAAAAAARVTGGGAAARWALWQPPHRASPPSREPRVRRALTRRRRGGGASSVHRRQPHHFAGPAALTVGTRPRVAQRLGQYPQLGERDVDPSPARASFFSAARLLPRRVVA